jgi:putative ABC transport system ATP-binding protein
VLAAYKDLSSPWKELLDFYQNQQDVAIKYEQVVEQFQVPNLLDVRLLLETPAEAPKIEGDLTLANVGLVDGDGIRLLDGISFTLPLGDHAALVGPSNSGKNIVPQLLARLCAPTGGRISLGDTDLETLPFAVSGRLVGYVGPATHLFAAGIRDNLLLGLRTPPGPAADEANKAGRARAIEEARRSGNTELDVSADWIDYQQAGVADAAELDRRIIDVLALVGLYGDIYLFGLHGRLDPESHPEAPDRLLEARRRFGQRAEALGLARFVERFDPEHFNTNASLADNLLFGTPIGPVFDGDGLAENPYVQQVLRDAGLTDELFEAGRKLAGMMVELFGDSAPGHTLAEEFGFVRGEELHEFERILARTERTGRDTLSTGDRTRLLGLALKLVAARDRLGLVDDELRERIVAARRVFADNLPQDLRDSVEFFDPERYNAAARVEENILFGTIVSGEAEARERVEQAIGEVLDELGLRHVVLAVGLDYQVGTGGSRLSPAQRQKTAIARAVLKRPMLLALDEATVVLDPAAETRILNALRQEFEGRSILAALPRPEAAQGFDRVLLMEQGRVVSEGTYDEVVDAVEEPAPRLAAE